MALFTRLTPPNTIARSQQKRLSNQNPSFPLTRLLAAMIVTLVVVQIKLSFTSNEKVGENLSLQSQVLASIIVSRPCWPNVILMYEKRLWFCSVAAVRIG
jgi:hypothetical protein